MDILAENAIKIDEKLVIKFGHQCNKSIDREVKNNCKIMKLSENNMNEVLTRIAALNREEYPNLFIFIVVESENISFLKIRKPKNLDEKSKIKRKVKAVHNLKAALLKFAQDRPLIMQLKSEEENKTKIYFKEENSNQFVFIHQGNKNVNNFHDFSTFFRLYMNGNYEKLLNKVTEELPKVANSSLILRFLRTMKIPEEFFRKMVLKIAKCGTKSDLFAALDAPFEAEGRTLNARGQKYLSEIFYEDHQETEAFDEPQVDQKEEASSENDTASHASFNSNECSSEDGSVTDSEDSSSETLSVSTTRYLNTSVLHAAVENKNTEIIEYLIAYGTHLIQQLSTEHQISIATAAFETNQLDILCDLLEISDFPFPDNFKEDSTEHKRLLKISTRRTKLEVAMKAENFREISKFVKKNPDLKIVYNLNNISALKQALNSNKYKVYFYLKSLGFQASEFHELREILNDEELKEANKHSLQQVRGNVRRAHQDDQTTVNLLFTKSLIHNRKVGKDKEADYRKHIMKWYQDIYKIEPEMLDVAASCEHLKLIFDFESQTIENVSLDELNASGSMYPLTRWIFVGAKLCDKKREQEIKGVLAHELCHYVMRLVYENQENPYFKYNEKDAALFEEIAKATDKWSTEGAECPDDECNGIISLVFKLYSNKDFQPELIVRVVQILAEFDDDEEKSKYLEKKYETLFSFWKDHVIPELRIYLRKDKHIVKLNGIIGNSSTFSNQNIEFSVTKDINKMISNKLVIVSTNVPKLLFINIHKYLQEKIGSLLDSKNLFVDPENLNNSQILDDYALLCGRNEELNIFVDCTKGELKVLARIFINKELNFFFVVSNEHQSEKLTQIFREKGMKKPVKIQINYNFNDLKVESQKMLLQTKINFQNNFKISLLDLIGNKFDAEKSTTDELVENQEEGIIKKFFEIIDDELLNLLVEKSKISINTNFQQEEKFEIIFQPRKFIKNEKEERKTVTTYSYIRGAKPKELPTISVEELLLNVQNNKYVLISDVAGNGKSWMMKHLTKVLRDQNPTKWVTYVDLKQFIDEFKAQKSEYDFSTFTAEKILKPKQQFEAKIFQRLYKDGKVFILFDGFDEIAPNCAEFVSKLAKSFEFNGGNQLWIATRDYFEIDLQQKLQLDDIYSLNKLSEDDGVNLIAVSWLLKDIKDVNDIKSKNEFEKYIKSSSNFKKYQEKARLVIKKVQINWYHAVELPQIFKMTADVFGDENDSEFDLKESEIYKKFVYNLYRKWADEKGKLRKEASIVIQSNELNFWKFHQYVAVKRWFFYYAELLFPDHARNEWSDEEIIACGLMGKNGEKFYFLHETFCEFFISDFLSKELKKSKIKENVLEIFAEILCNGFHKTIQIFINDLVGNYSTLERIQPEMLNFVDKFYKISNLYDLFIKNLEHLVSFVISILKTGDYEKVKEILNENATIILDNAREAKMAIKFTEFMFEFLKVDDLKDLIKEKRIVQDLIQIRSDIEVFEEFISQTEAVIDRQFVQDILRTEDLNNMGGSIFHCLSDSSNLTTHKVQKVFRILQNFFTIAEVFELLKRCDKYQINILQFCVKIPKNFKIMWVEIEAFFVSQNMLKDFKEFVMQPSSFNRNILHSAIECDKIELHKDLWEFLLKSFVNRDELKNVILQKNKREENFVHNLVGWGENLEVIEFTFKILKENFSETQFREILKSKGWYKTNLLQWGHSECKVEFHETLWKYFRDSFKCDDEFLEIIKEVDEVGNNFLHNAACSNIRIVFEFFMTEFEKIATFDEIRKMLGDLNETNNNLLQIVVFHDSTKLHENVWKNLQRFFEPSEILEFIKHVNNAGDNLLLIAAKYSPKEIIELTWTKIKDYMNQSEQIEYLKMKGKDGKNLNKIPLENFFYKDVHNWVKGLMHDYGIDQ